MPPSPPSHGPDRTHILATTLALVLLGGSLSLMVTLLWQSPQLESQAILPATSFIALLVGVRLALWMAYAPLQTQIPDSDLPTLTLVIPAFNEGEAVQTAIESALDSDYPADRLQVIVVDDGSTDDTWRHVQEAVAGHDGRARALKLPKNMGKRHALFEGLSLAQTDLVATLDSDSRLERGSLRALVLPMVCRPNVGAVAGKVMVENRSTNFITRMLGVRYILGFDLIRAYQSQLGTVWCCPGALQAYRRAVIAPLLSAWRDQRFLGAQCTNGDDHAMTNNVLALGWDTVYQSNARVHTLVPETYLGLTRMYTRWGRSATREGLRALLFAPKRAWLLGGVKGAWVLLDALLQPLGILARFLVLALLLSWLNRDPTAVLGLLGGAGLGALIYAAIYLRSERSKEVVFGVCYAFFALMALCWVQPYATLTVRGNRWLTRSASAKNSVPQSPTGT